MKWLGLRPKPRRVRSIGQSEDEWRRADQLSLFLLVHHHKPASADRHNSLGVSTYNSLITAGFADGWTKPLTGGPRRHPLLDVHTRSEFVTLERSGDMRRLAQLTVTETYAWDGLYRSDISATGISFQLAVHDTAMDRLIEKVLIGEHDAGGGSPSCVFAVRIPLRRRFAFPEARASEKPYSEGPDPKPLGGVASARAEWIEVAALDGERMRSEQVDGLPLSQWYADAGPVRISFGE